MTDVIGLGRPFWWLDWGCWGGRAQVGTIVNVQERVELVGKKAPVGAIPVPWNSDRSETVPVPVGGVKRMDENGEHGQNGGKGTA